MAYIIKTLKKINFKKPKVQNKSFESNKVFIFIILLSTIIIGVDYALVMNFIEMLKNI